MHLRRAPSLVVAILTLFLIPGTVLAHAELVSSDPADGATVGTDAGTISATFSETIDPGRSSMELLSPTGQTVATGTVDASGTSMTLDHPALDPGTYTVRWTTVTPDDNGVERGTFKLIVTASATTPAPSTAPAATASGGATPIPVDSQPPTSPAPSADPSSGSSGSGGVADVLLPIVVAIVVVGGVLVLVRRRASA